MSVLNLSNGHATNENRCTVCDAAPIREGAEYCSNECYRANQYTCDICGTFTPRPMRHRQQEHPETITDTTSTTDTSSTPLEPSGPIMFGEADGDSPGQHLDAPDGRQCQCTGCDGVGEAEGHTGPCDTAVSIPYARVFAHEDGSLLCSDCQPRSERYTNNPVYGTPE